MRLGTIAEVDLTTATTRITSRHDHRFSAYCWILSCSFCGAIPFANKARYSSWIARASARVISGNEPSEILVLFFVVGVYN